MHVGQFGQSQTSQEGSQALVRGLGRGRIESGENSLFYSVMSEFFQHLQWVACKDVMSSAQCESGVFWVKVCNLLASIELGLLALAYHFWQAQRSVHSASSVRHRSSAVRASSSSLRLARVGDCFKVVDRLSRRASRERQTERRSRLRIAASWITCPLRTAFCASQRVTGEETDPALRLK